MKLDDTVVQSVMDRMVELFVKTPRPRFMLVQMRKKLYELDLVIKPYDASQSILVENRPKNKDVDYQELYDKNK